MKIFSPRKGKKCGNLGSVTCQTRKIPSASRVRNRVWEDLILRDFGGYK